MTLLPSTLRPSAILYAVFMSFLCSYSMKAYPRGLPANGELCQILVCDCMLKMQSALLKRMTGHLTYLLPCLLMCLAGVTRPN